jgi:hypothetical protein
MPANFKIIINYTETDNNPNIESGIGWVDSFERFLDLMLHQVLGSKPEIIMANGAEALKKDVAASADVMINIISMDFLENAICMDLLEDYYQKSRTKEDGIQHLFKVMKTPIPIRDQPLRMRELIGYDMFHYDEDNQEVKEFTSNIGPDTEREFWMKMVDVVYDLNETYLDIHGIDSGTQIRPINQQRSVFLAETGHDMTIQRNIIKRELQRYGFTVPPEHALPATHDEIVKEVNAALEQCSMSIHLIGQTYGVIPDGGTVSIVDLQNQLAATWCIKQQEDNKKNETKRFIWIAPSLQAASEKQLTFIENVKRDIASLEGAEILQTPLEDFKGIIREELFGKKQGLFNFFEPEDSTDTNQKVYLIHDQVDKESVEPIVSGIENMGYTVLEPSFQGDLLDMREGHIKNLRHFDYALVYQGHVNDQWVRMKLLDLMKAPGFGRRKPILNKGVLISKYSKGDFENLNKDTQVEVFHEAGEEPPLKDIQKFLQTRKQVL